LASGLKTSVRIEGLDRLRRIFRELPEALQEKELGNAVSKGAAVIGREAQRLAPELKTDDPRRTKGLLRRMIRWTRGVRRSSEAAAFVSVRRPGKKAVAKAKRGGSTGSHIDPWYWKLIEFGTSRMKAIPFLRPAYESKKMEAVETIKNELAIGIDKQAKRLARTK
jgi:HK97 gp10 family phage protein